MNKSNYQRQIVDYYKKNLAKGYTMESLRWALINQGYSKVVVEKAIEETTRELATQAPILKEKPEIKYQLIDEDNKPVNIKKPWWKKIFGI